MRQTLINSPVAFLGFFFTNFIITFDVKALNTLLKQFLKRDVILYSEPLANIALEWYLNFYFVNGCYVEYTKTPTQNYPGVIPYYPDK